MPPVRPEPKIVIADSEPETSEAERIEEIRNIDVHKAESEREQGAVIQSDQERMAGMWQGFRRRTLIEIWEMGCILQKIKAGGAGEEFRNYLAKIEMARSTAYRYMKIADSFQKPELLEYGSVDAALKTLSPAKSEPRLITTDSDTKVGVLQREYQQLQKRVATLQREKDELQAAIRSKNELQAAIRSKEIGLKTKVGVLQRENQQLQKQVASLQQEKDRLQHLSPNEHGP